MSAARTHQHSGVDQTRPNDCNSLAQAKQKQNSVCSGQRQVRVRQRRTEREREGESCRKLWRFFRLIINLCRLQERDAAKDATSGSRTELVCIATISVAKRKRERGREVEDVVSSIIVATISGINYLHHGTVVEYYRKFVVEILKTC